MRCDTAPGDEIKLKFILLSATAFDADILLKQIVKELVKSLVCLKPFLKSIKSLQLYI